MKMAKNKETFEKAKQFMASKDNFALATHTRTDGDDLGSMLAVAHALERAGKKFTMAVSGGVPRSLRFLPKQAEVLEDLAPNINQDICGNFGGIILFGCCNPKRTHIAQIIAGAQNGLPILNFDHHPDNEFYGEVNVVDTGKSSVAELVYDFLKYAEAQIDAPVATCLLAGIIHDTGSFMHENTTAETLKASGELLNAGARTDKIFNSIFRKNLDDISAWGKALANLKIDAVKEAALCILSEKDLQEIKVRQGTFEGFVDILNTIPGMKFSMFVRQDGELIKGSVRSREEKNTDVSDIARLFGGGGHKLASGFALKGRLNKKPDGYCEVLPG